MSVSPPSVTRRRVHYVSGFDPRGAAHYHRLFRDQAQARQSSGARLRVGARKRQGGDVHTWSVEWCPPGSSAPDAEAAVRTEHAFMSWDGVIRAFWPRGVRGLIAAWMYAYRAMVFEIGVRRPRAIYPKAVLTGALPLAYTLLGVLLGLMCGAAVWYLGLGAWGAATLCLALWAGAAWLGERLRLWWLLRIFAFVMRMGKAPPPQLSVRVRAMVEQIIERQRADPVDEVLLVGHSIGTLVLVDVLDALQADARWQAVCPTTRTCVLTLGQCYPFVTLTRDAGPFREALQRLCADSRLCWLDVTALIDPLCFYRAHPLEGTGLRARRHAMPVSLAARFKHMYPPERWGLIKRDKLLAHFLYLMAPDQAGNFDLYDLLYGPLPFAQRVDRLKPH